MTQYRKCLFSAAIAMLFLLTGCEMRFTSKEAAAPESTYADEKDEIIPLITYSSYGEVIENPALQKELIPIAEKICMADSRGRNANDVPRTDEIVETIPPDGPSYYPVLPELASDKESLFSYFHTVYTEDYIARMEPALEDRLFGAKSTDFLAKDVLYKMIDGRLCVLDGYWGVPVYYDTNSLKILKIPSPDTVSVALDGRDVG